MVADSWNWQGFSLPRDFAQGWPSQESWRLLDSGGDWPRGVFTNDCFSSYDDIPYSQAQHSTASSGSPSSCLPCTASPWTYWTTSGGRYPSVAGGVYQQSAKHRVAECFPLKDSSGYLHQSSQGTRELSPELNSWCLRSQIANASQAFNTLSAAAKSSQQLQEDAMNIIKQESSVEKVPSTAMEVVELIIILWVNWGWS